MILGEIQRVANPPSYRLENVFELLSPGLKNKASSANNRWIH